LEATVPRLERDDIELTRIFQEAFQEREENNMKAKKRRESLVATTITDSTPKAKKQKLTINTVE